MYICGASHRQTLLDILRHQIGIERYQLMVDTLRRSDAMLAATAPLQLQQVWVVAGFHALITRTHTRSTSVCEMSLV